MRQVASCPCVKGKLTEEGWQGEKRGYHKGSYSYQDSAKDTNRLQKGKESNGPQNNTEKEGNGRNLRERKPGECIRESSAHIWLGLNQTIRGVVRRKPVRWGLVREGQRVSP